MTGEADVTTSALQDVLGAEVARRPRLLLIDMSGLSFLDSSALHVVIAAHRELHRAGLALALLSPGTNVTRLLALTGIDQVIPVHASVEEAIAALAVGRD